MGKILAKINAIVLSLAMAFSMVSAPAAVHAEEKESIPVFDEDTSYALVAQSTGKAVRVNEISWQENGAVYVDGTITADKKVKAKSEFKIKTNDDGTYSFASVANNGEQLKCENVFGAGIDFVFNLEKGGNNHKYTLEPSGNGYKIKSFEGAYLGLGPNDRLDKVENADKAEVFKIEEISQVIDEYVSIQNTDTKKYVSFKDQADLSPVKVNADNVSDTEKFLPSHQTCDNHEATEEIKGSDLIDTFGLQSKSSPEMTIISTNWADGAQDAIVAKKTNPGGWESVVVAPNGDGTVSLRSSYSFRYATVNDNNELEFCDKTSKELTSKEKFIIHSTTEIKQVSGLSAEPASKSVQLKWDKLGDQIISGYEVWRCETKDGQYTKIADDVADNTYTDETVNKSTTYYYKVRAVNGSDNEKVNGEFSDAVEAQTLAGERPYAPKNLAVKADGESSVKLTWEASGNEADNGRDLKYVIYAAPSAYSKDYKVVEGKDNVEGTSCTINYTKDTKYQYYKVAAKDADTNQESRLSKDGFASLETEMFGDHTLIFADTDDTKVVDKLLSDLFEEQNDSTKDAQFKADHYQVYFKPGDYKETSCINLGFYTAINGLGQTPDDVELNNISIPAYLTDNNATCNFWRSIENFKVVNTKNEQGKSTGYRPDQLNWAVAQAAPMRRIHSERAVAYDWNFGWASGGYVADSKIDGSFEDNGKKLSAGTFSGQQFYTRNSELAANAYGTTLNNFFQGVVAPNLPTAKNGTALADGKGYSNWAVKGKDKSQQVFTNVENTEKLAEKPFLYMKDGEYQVFVPAVDNNTKGVSWGDGKENDGMGKGTSIPLSKFYIASPKDSAKKINAEIAKGKNIYLTPGVYKAEEPINVNKEGTIVLGTGLATIIPENKEAAMKIADVDGVRVCGVIFDAGKDSEYLLKAGEKKTDKSHSKNPTVLSDLFFRIGGTTSTTTSADNALAINSNDVLTDHFWIWRADHGAGVSWKGNPAQHGLLVNGDNVTCYALFNEHFENYTTLWNGENGATYFYQNETAYDAITQDAKNKDAWLSHNGAVKGYASYKVANNVKKHYAVGLGIYNVFIYTGGGAFDTEHYDGAAQIELDNGIEVPNKDGVIVENACMQTFAKDGEAGGMYQATNAIINGVGGSVTSGYKRSESRAEDGSLNGKLLDADGNELPTKIYKTESTNEHGKKEFKYLVREMDDEGREIIIVNNKELDYDALKDKNYTCHINKDTGSVTIKDQSGNDVDWANDDSLFREKGISKAVKGTGWGRVFLTRYQNGTATFGRTGKVAEDVGKFNGLKTKNNVAALGDDNLDMDALSKLAAKAKALNSKDYTQTTWKPLESALATAENALSENGRKYTLADEDNMVEINKKEVDFISFNKTMTALENAINGLKKTPAAQTTAKPNNKPEIKVNQTITIKGITYKVTKVFNAKNAQVKVIKVNKNNKSAVIPNTISMKGATCKVVSIGKNAAYKCKKLKKVTIGKNVSVIESKAFYGCKKLKTITIKSTVLKKVNSKAIKGIHKKAVIKVPKKQYKKYKKLFGKKKTGFKKPMKVKK